MTPLTELLELFCSVVETQLEISINTSELPADGGVYAEVGAGKTECVYYDKSVIRTIPIHILCKAATQEDCLETLDKICCLMQSLKEYPEAVTFKWLDAAVETEEDEIAKKDGEAYVFACRIYNKIYY